MTGSQKPCSILRPGRRSSTPSSTALSIKRRTSACCCRSIATPSSALSQPDGYRSTDCPVRGSLPWSSASIQRSMTLCNTVPNVRYPRSSVGKRTTRDRNHRRLHVVKSPTCETEITKQIGWGTSDPSGALRGCRQITHRSLPPSSRSFSARTVTCTALVGRNENTSHHTSPSSKTCFAQYCADYRLFLPHQACVLPSHTQGPVPS